MSEYDPNEHPKGPDGRWVNKADGGEPSALPENALEDQDYRLQDNLDDNCPLRFNGSWYIEDVRDPDPFDPDNAKYLRDSYIESSIDSLLERDDSLFEQRLRRNREKYESEIGAHFDSQYQEWHDNIRYGVIEQLSQYDDGVEPEDQRKVAEWAAAQDSDPELKTEGENWLAQHPDMHLVDVSDKQIEFGGVYNVNDFSDSEDDYIEPSIQAHYDERNRLVPDESLGDWTPLYGKSNYPDWNFESFEDADNSQIQKWVHEEGYKKFALVEVDDDTDLPDEDHSPIGWAILMKDPIEN